MTTIYTYKDQEYPTLYALKHAMPNVSFPANPSDEALEALGITIRTIADPVPEPPTLDEVKTIQKGTIAAARYDAEIAGITVQGIGVATDRESQSLLSAAVLQTLFDNEYTVKWKTKAGFIELNATMLQMVATAVRQHVQDCFNREADLNAEIDACETAEDVAAVVWEV